MSILFDLEIILKIPANALKWSLTSSQHKLHFFLALKHILKIDFLTVRMPDHVDPPSTPYRLPLLQTST